jgi:hypothetical protein
MVYDDLVYPDDSVIVFSTRYMIEYKEGRESLLNLVCWVEQVELERK